MPNSYAPDKRPLCPICRLGQIKSVGSTRCADCRYRPGWHLGATPTEPAPPPTALKERILAVLRKAPTTQPLIALACDATEGQVLDAIHAMQGSGANLHQFGAAWSLERAPEAGSLSVEAYRSRGNGTYRFGWLGDTHLCSKYARLDVLTDIYRRFADADIDRIFHAGNYIDGEARFNKFDLLVHGMDAQVRYLRDEYPVAPNRLITYAVDGDDHEGWYCQREGVDIGRYVENVMKEGGRSDWRGLGYMEAFVPLEHAHTGKTAQLHLVHPGGGSAYAISYTAQKLVESYAGGNKPAVLLAGHYHKLEYLCTRNVHCIQTGCTQDQTPFARKKRLQFALGGGTCELEQDPETGAIVGVTVQVWNYFDAGYYTNQRFSHSGSISLPQLTRGGAGAVLV